MKKLFLTLGMFIAAVVFSGISAQAETISFERVLEVPGSTKEQLFDKVRTWSDRYSREHRDDAGSGVIVAYGEVAYPDPPVDRIQYTFPFKMKNTIQGNKVTVTFEEVMLKSPTTYLPPDTAGLGPETMGGAIEPLKSKKDIAVANKILNHIVDNLDSFLLAKDATKCPLMRCPHCGLLETSPKEMEEHMKTHGGHKSAPK